MFFLSNFLLESFSIFWIELDPVFPSPQCKISFILREFSLRRTIIIGYGGVVSIGYASNNSNNCLRSLSYFNELQNCACSLLKLALVKADSFLTCGVPLVVILASDGFQFANRSIPEVSSLLNPQSALHNQISTVALETARASDERLVPDSAQSEHVSLLPLVGGVRQQTHIPCWVKLCSRDLLD